MSDIKIVEIFPPIAVYQASITCEERYDSATELTQEPCAIEWHDSHGTVSLSFRCRDSSSLKLSKTTWLRNLDFKLGLVHVEQSLAVQDGN